MSSTFLNRDEIKDLTGRSYVRMQIEALRRMGLPFFINDIGRPVVARSVIEGRAKSATVPKKKEWVPDVLKNG